MSGTTLRLSPRDVLAYWWMWAAGYAKLVLGQDEEALAWLRRAIEANRSFPSSYFHLAATLAQLGRIEQARDAAKAGFALNPGFAIRRAQEAGAALDNPIYLTQRERVFDGWRKIGIPEG